MNRRDLLKMLVFSPFALTEIGWDFLQEDLEPRCDWSNEPLGWYLPGPGWEFVGITTDYEHDLVIRNNEEVNRIPCGFPYCRKNGPDAWDIYVRRA